MAQLVPQPKLLRMVAWPPAKLRQSEPQFEERFRGAETKRHPVRLPATHRPHSGSFLGLPYRILNMNPKKELLWGLWVKPS